MSKGGIIAIVVIVIVIIVAAVWLGLGFALGRASGPVVTEEREVAGFTNVDVSGDGRLIITVGDQPALRIEGQEDILDRIDTEVRGDTLHIGQRWSWLRFAPFWEVENVTYYLTVPELAGIEMSGAVDVLGEGALQGEQLAIECSGSSVIHLDLSVGVLSVDTSGSSDVILRGSADQASYDTSGSGTIRALDLASRVVTIDCSGSSDTEVNVSESLTVDISGSGSVSYLGDPTLTIDVSGSGEVNRLEQ